MLLKRRNSCDGTPLRRGQVILIFALAFGGWIGLQMHGAHRQREAVQTIRAQGGVVDYHFPLLLPPEWLQDQLGEDALKAVWYVLMQGPQFDDQSLDLLQDFTELHIVDVRHSSITDAGLARLAHLLQLRYLDVRNTAVTADGVAQLAGLRKLTTVYLHDTGVSEEDLPRLQSLLPHTEFLLGQHRNRSWPTDPTELLPAEPSGGVPPRQEPSSPGIEMALQDRTWLILGI